MKILICGSTQGEYGGIEAVMFSLANYLEAQKGIDCILAFKLIKGAKLKPSLANQIESIETPTYVINRMDFKLINLIHDVDIVHTQNVPPDIVFTSKLLGKPVISITHNYRKKNLSPHNFIWKFSSVVCDFVTFNSKFVQSTWQRNPFYNRKNRVIPTLSELPPKHQCGGERKGFAFISRWIPNKGADLLIEAYSRSEINKKEWPLIMMGDGPLREGLEKKVKDENIEGITIRGRVSEKEKCDRIASSKWIIVPPNTQEDMGLTPIEGRMLGTPTIASKDGGVPESAGKHAMLFDPGNIHQLTTLIENVAQWDEEAYLRVARSSQISLFKYIKPLSVYTNLYQEVVGINQKKEQFV